MIALGWVSLLTDVATEMVFPLLPRFIDTVLGAGKLGLGLIEGVAESTAALVRLPSGVWSDRLRRRKPLVLAGYSVAGLVRPLMGLAVAPWQALVIRFTDRLGKGMRGAPRDALIADVTDPSVRGRAFGFHRAMDHAGAAIGPVLAFVFISLWPMHLRTLFLLTLVPGLIVLAVLLIAVREPPRRPATSDLPEDHPSGPPALTESAAGVQSSQPGPRWSLAAFAPHFRWFLLALVVFTLGNSTDAFLLIRAEELGVPYRYLPLLWFAFHVAKSAANLFWGRWSDRLDPRRLILAGWLVYAAVYLGFGFAHTVLEVAVLFLLYAVYYGLTEPAEKALVALWVPADLRGTAYGWYNLMIGVMALPASLIFGGIWQLTAWGAPAAFAFGAALSLVAAALLAMTFVFASDAARPKGDERA